MEHLINMKTDLEIILEAIKLEASNPDIPPFLRRSMRNLFLRIQTYKSREEELEIENERQAMNNSDPLGQH